MARYIDADALIERILKLKVVTDDMYGMGIARGIERAETAIEMQPAADVVPKSEVAIEVLDEAIRAVYSKIDMKIYNTIEGKPLGDGVAFGKQQAMYDVITLLAELKKKYTEGKE